MTVIPSVREVRLREYIKPYLDEGYMDSLFLKDEKQYFKKQRELIEAYGMNVPLKSNAPQRVVECYKELGIINRERSRDTYEQQKTKVTDGGKGSGNFGHKGRPGQKGGSGAGGAKHVSDLIPEDSYTLKPEYKKMQERLRNTLSSRKTLSSRVSELREQLKAESKPKPKEQWNEDDEYEALLGRKPMSYTSIGEELKKQLDECSNEYREADSEYQAVRKELDEYKAKCSIEQLRQWEPFKPKEATQTEYEGFDITTTGTTGGDELLKSKRSYIAEMSPEEYLKRCAYDIFQDATFEGQINAGNESTTEKYVEEMRNGTKFDLPYLNYATSNQEGRHRAIAAYMLGIEKIPVLVYGYDQKWVEHERDYKLSMSEALPDDVFLLEDSDINPIETGEEVRQTVTEGNGKALADSSKVRDSFNRIMLKYLLTHKVKRGTIVTDREYVRNEKGQFASVPSSKGGESKSLKQPDITIPHSVGASSRISHEPIDVPGCDYKAFFVEGTRIKNVEVFAGKGTKTPIKSVNRLVSEYPDTKAEDWEKVKGFATVMCDGEEHECEVHWYHSEKTGGIHYKVKIRNGRMWLDED